MTDKLKPPLGNKTWWEYALGIFNPYEAGSPKRKAARDAAYAEIDAMQTELAELRASNTLLRRNFEQEGAELARLLHALEEVGAWIASQGYRKCDIAACDCGMWHGGLAGERLREFGEELGIERTDGNSLLGALKELISENAELSKRKPIRGYHDVTDLYGDEETT